MKSPDNPIQVTNEWINLRPSTGESCITKKTKRSDSIRGVVP